MKNLVIVESPTKAKTISKFLGPDFVVKSSFGHVRDLPKTEMGVDIEHDFQPHYVIPPDKRKIITELKKAISKNTQIYFATDADREGEAISWHLANIFNLKPEGIKRLTFHEITKEAILEALKNPRPLDLHLVDAQQARRVLDRLVGYELSPWLWKKVAKGLSAGRVQSVAVRLTVEREREIQNFKKEEYWDIEGVFVKEKEDEKEKFIAKLHQIDGKILEKLAIKNEDEAQKILKELENSQYEVEKVERKSLKRTPLPPFITSSLQQEANRRFGFSAKQTMLLAQQLYEGVDLPDEGAVGLITYMRTDSVNLSDNFLKQAQQFISASYGDQYLSASVRRYQTKSKLAQEAHEAIRPTDVNRAPESLQGQLEPRQWKLYDLIWKRAVATQMAPAKVESTTIDIVNADKSRTFPRGIDPVEGSSGKVRDKKYLFRALGIQIKFDGFLKIYPSSQKENLLPSLQEKDKVRALDLTPKQHFTEPPARYSDATLVKALEEYGIGRPSTYAPTISTIIARQYVERVEKGRLKPTEIALLVNDILVEHFPQIVDYQFTAKMEDGLDEVAKGEKKWPPLIRDFYKPFKKNLQKKYQELSKKELTEEKSAEICEKCGSAMVVKLGRFGRFLACSNFPKCKNTKSLNDKADRQPKTEPILLEEKCPQCQSPLVQRRSRYGEFISCSAFPKCRYIKESKEKTTGVKCPECQKGEIVERRTRRRKIFYSCSRYPDCKFALWQKPIDQKCPHCGSIMTEDRQGATKCSNKICPK